MNLTFIKLYIYINLKGPAKLSSLGRCLEKAVGGKLNEMHKECTGKPVEFTYISNSEIWPIEHLNMTPKKFY